MSVVRPSALLAAAALAAVAIGAAVRTGVTGRFDAATLLFLDARRGPAWLVETARDLTALGSNGVLGLLVILLAADAAIAGRRRDAASLVGTFLGGLVLVAVAKAVVERPRPGVVEPLARVFTTSFPSSHATLSAAVATILVLLSRRSSARPASTRFRLGAAMLVCAAIGLSRVALGVHWPTDVLAGWCLGLAWGTACWLIAR